MDDDSSDFESHQPRVRRLEGENVDPQPSKRARGKGQVWEKILSIESQSVDELRNWMKTYGATAGARWSKRRTDFTQDGSKDYFFCSMAGCNAQLQVLYASTGFTTTVSHNGEDHVHNPATPARGLSKEAKKVVEELYETGVKKPLQLNSALLNRGISGHSMKQLNNFITRLKTKLQGPATISYAELEEWCNQHSRLPEEEDDSYVVHHDVSPTSGVHVILSTKRLLVNATQSEVVHMDATYKLTWHGFPIIIAGVSDRARQFFPVVFGVMQSETSEEYSILLQAMKASVEEVSGTAFKPRIVVADCADAITGAIDKVFPEAKRGHCWFHVKKAVETRLRREPKEMQTVCKADITNLQLCYCQEQFDMAVQLALDKWRHLWPESEFPAYFAEQYVDRYNGWFEGFDISAPSTNNGLESLNGSIKTNHTLRERLPVGRFVVAAQSMVRDWSRDLVGRRQFQHRPVADLSVMTKAYHQLQKNSVLVEVNHDTLFVRSGEEGGLTTEEVDRYCQVVEEVAPSFDEFVRQRFSMWRVQDPAGKTDAYAMWCTCPEGLKKFVCKHSIAIGSLFGLVEFSEVARAVPVGRKRKRGRPALARPALEHQ